MLCQPIDKPIKNRLEGCSFLLISCSTLHGWHRHLFPDFSLLKIKFFWPNKCKMPDPVAASSLPIVHSSFPPFIETDKLINFPSSSRESIVEITESQKVSSSQPTVLIQRCYIISMFFFTILQKSIFLDSIYIDNHWRVLDLEEFTVPWQFSDFRQRYFDLNRRLPNKQKTVVMLFFFLYRMFHYYHFRSATFKLKHRVRVSEIWLASCLDDVCESTKAVDKSFVIGWPTTNFVAAFK